MMFFPSNLHSMQQQVRIVVLIIVVCQLWSEWMLAEAACQKSEIPMATMCEEGRIQGSKLLITTPSVNMNLDQECVCKINANTDSISIITLKAPNYQGCGSAIDLNFSNDRMRFECFVMGSSMDTQIQKTGTISLVKTARNVYSTNYCVLISSTASNSGNVTVTCEGGQQSTTDPVTMRTAVTGGVTMHTQTEAIPTDSLIHISDTSKHTATERITSYTAEPSVRGSTQHTSISSDPQTAYNTTVHNTTTDMTHVTSTLVTLTSIPSATGGEGVTNVHVTAGISTTQQQNTEWQTVSNETTPEQSTQTTNTGTTPEQSRQTTNTDTTPEQSTQTTNTDTTPEQSRQTTNTGTTPDQYTQTTNTDTTPEQSRQTTNTDTTPEQSTQTTNTDTTPNQYTQTTNTTSHQYTQTINTTPKQSTQTTATTQDQYTQTANTTPKQYTETTNTDTTQDQYTQTTNTTPKQYTETTNTDTTPDQYTQTTNTDTTPEQSRQTTNTDTTPDQYTQTTNTTPKQYTETTNTDTTPEQYTQTTNTDTTPHQYTHTTSIDTTPDQYTQTTNTTPKQSTQTTNTDTTPHQYTHTTNTDTTPHQYTHTTNTDTTPHQYTHTTNTDTTPHQYTHTVSIHTTPHQYTHVASIGTTQKQSAEMTRTDRSHVQYTETTTTETTQTSNQGESIVNTPTNTPVFSEYSSTNMPITDLFTEINELFHLKTTSGATSTDTFKEHSTVTAINEEETTHGGATFLPPTTKSTSIISDKTKQWGLITAAPIPGQDVTTNRSAIFIKNTSPQTATKTRPDETFPSHTTERFDDATKLGRTKEDQVEDDYTAVIIVCSVIGVGILTAIFGSIVIVLISRRRRSASIAGGASLTGSQKRLSSINSVSMDTEKGEDNQMAILEPSSQCNMYPNIKNVYDNQ